MWESTLTRFVLLYVTMGMMSANTKVDLEPLIHSSKFLGFHLVNFHGRGLSHCIKAVPTIWVMLEQPGTKGKLGEHPETGTPIPNGLSNLLEVHRSLAGLLFLRQR